MSIRKSIVLAAVLSCCGVSPRMAAAEPLDQLSAGAQHDLEASLAELSELRQTIAADKVPLARRLAALEEHLAELRREYDTATRKTDESALDLTGLRSEIKLRQDEVAYIGTLLDEYRGTFESRLNVGELQRYEPVIQAAKQASGDKRLATADRFDLQMALVKTSVARLQDLIGGARFPGQAVDAHGAVADGTYAVVGPVTLFAANVGTTAGIAVSQSGSTRPAIHTLEPALGAAARSVVQDGQGTLPLDPSRGGALKELVRKGNVLHIFKKGGPIMWPLLLASVLALGTVIERMLFIFTEKRRRDDEALKRMLDAVEEGDTEKAREIGRKTPYFVCRALTYALEHKEKSLSNALLLAQSLEIKRFSRGIPILDTVITLAPLLGLLGTVTGMMNSFSIIGGELSSPSAITGGIAEALIATAFGLGIAITALIPFNYLNSRVEEVRHELDAASTRLELLVHPPRDAGIPHPEAPVTRIAAMAGR